MELRANANPTLISLPLGKRKESSFRTCSASASQSTRGVLHRFRTHHLPRSYVHGFFSHEGGRLTQIKSYSANVASTIPVLLSAIRILPPSEGPVHDGKEIGKDVVTYTYKQACHVVPSSHRCLAYCSAMLSAHPHTILSHCHRRRKCSLPCMPQRRGQAMEDRRVG